MLGDTRTTVVQAERPAPAPERAPGADGTGRDGALDLPSRRRALVALVLAVLRRS